MWELHPTDDDDEDLMLLQYSSEELSAIQCDPLDEIGVGGFSSVYRGQLPDSGMTVAIKCPREDKSAFGVLESLSKEMWHRQ